MNHTVRLVFRENFEVRTLIWTSSLISTVQHLLDGFAISDAWSNSSQPHTLLTVVVDQISLCKDLCKHQVTFSDLLNPAN